MHAPSKPACEQDHYGHTVTWSPPPLSITEGPVHSIDQHTNEATEVASQGLTGTLETPV